ncbi:DUF4382 domain-containing protein [Chitinophaga sedimenti]|uniref:DUF4382 domain-containing protein n=1 Tax=Chitinophaga sedimenti TaxID=2033606 RepID=UPI002004C416|nr:DUF4382 domain-containing protein [Chitinophaga sedimenti]MCK7556266.1 DUF4382 domain-containing protein [Chitinophaga sedimenti]
MTASALFVSCQKNEDNSGKARLEIRLTDAPASYDAVNIDIQKILINASDGGNIETGWVEVPLLHPGIYNLLDFRNGLDTVLANADVSAGYVNQIRLVLGDRNTVVIDGASHELKTPSAQQSGLKLKFKTELVAGVVYRLYIDFDASRSVVTAGNSGQYILKPVIRAYAAAVGGSIKGVVLPTVAATQVWAIQNTDTLLALPDAVSGYYFFGGLAAGDWRLVYDAQTPYRDTAFNVPVTPGAVTALDTVFIRQ